MRLSEISVSNFRCFGDGDSKLVLPFEKGLTVLVGENDTGKTAIIDALRFVLGTTDQEWYPLEDSDFHKNNTYNGISIVCKFEDLSPIDTRAFLEYLSYGEKDTDPTILYVNWTARDVGHTAKGRPYRQIEIHSGKNGDGPAIAPKVRELLRATYLRPLRDAEQALSAGRGSRLAQILQHTEQIKTSGHSILNEIDSMDLDHIKKLNVLGIGDLANMLLENQQGIKDTRNEIDKYISKLSIQGDGLNSNIKVSGVSAPESTRLRQLLEKLDLSLTAEGKFGLGSNNILFMACELLLLSQKSEGNRMLLIEEPEAHLHTQRQLRVMKSLQEQAIEKNIQIILTTHSPNIASAIKLDSMVMIRKGRGFSMSESKTNLAPSDYRFLERFLDVTKANLFFAQGVLIVEGDGENILIPTMASIINRDFIEYGVSIVNVGGTGLRRYARIFQRKNIQTDKQLDIPVACVTDLDIMPNCARNIINKKLKIKSEYDSKTLIERKKEISSKASGQCVQTYISDQWTLEYDLAFYGFSKEVYIAARLAEQDDKIDEKDIAKEIKKLEEEYKLLEEDAKKVIENQAAADSAYEEVVATKVYARFVNQKASKTIAAQYLAGMLDEKSKKPIEGVKDDAESKIQYWRNKFPPYLVSAIDYVTTGQKILNTSNSI